MCQAYIVGEVHEGGACFSGTFLCCVPRNVTSDGRVMSGINGQKSTRLHEELRSIFGHHVDTASMLGRIHLSCCH